MRSSLFKKQKDMNQAASNKKQVVANCYRFTTFLKLALENQLPRFTPSSFQNLKNCKSNEKIV